MTIHMDLPMFVLINLSVHKKSQHWYNTVLQREGNEEIIHINPSLLLTKFSKISEDLF